MALAHPFKGSMIISNSNFSRTVASRSVFPNHSCAHIVFTQFTYSSAPPRCQDRIAPAPQADVTRLCSPTSCHFPARLPRLSWSPDTFWIFCHSAFAFIILSPENSHSFIQQIFIEKRLYIRHCCRFLSCTAQYAVAI